MKKIGRLYREKIIDLIQKNTKDSGALFFINFKSLNATQLNILRLILKDKKSKLLVTKNRLMKMALKDSEFQLDEFLKTETGVVYSSEDAVDIAKALFDFKKEFEQLQIKGGLIDDKLVKSKELQTMSNLPSKAVLLGMTVNCIASPLTSFLSSLNQMILKFVWAIDEIKNKKEKN